MIEGHDYTIYSNGPGGRSRMYALIALITAFLTPLSQHGMVVLLRRYWGDDWDVAETALFFGGFTTLVIFGVLINVFDGYVWRTLVGRLMFRVAGLPAPPDLNGEYRGTIELHSSTADTDVFRTEYFMRISQSWEQLSLLVQRAAKAGGTVRVHSDMASLRVGMMLGFVTLQFVYTFEENLPRREGTGVMNRHFAGTATFEFRREGPVWVVEGHFFDDIGRSGTIHLREIPQGIGSQLPGSQPDRP